MFNKGKQCGYCYKPATTRLGLCDLDQFECYSESYVKCFWGLCDQQKSVHSFTKSETKVITQQPATQGLHNSRQSILVKN